jgi:hypothetical protein
LRMKCQLSLSISSLSIPNRLRNRYSGCSLAFFAIACNEVCTLTFRSCMYDLCSPLQTAYPVSSFLLRVLRANLTPDSLRFSYLIFRIAYLFPMWWTLTNAH